MINDINQKRKEYFTSQDIYDNNGLLLLKKGHKLTADVKKRLEKYGVDLEEYINTSNKKL